MSALRIVKLKPGANRAMSCSAGCRAVNKDQARSPTHRAYIASYHAGDLCRVCAKAWAAASEAEQTTLRVRVEPFEGVYLLTNPEVIESAMFGPCLRARYRMEGDPLEYDLGIFRVDRMTLIEPADEQLALAA